MKDTTKSLIAFIIFAILLVIFFTISALVPALKIAYTVLGTIAAITYFIILAIWLSDFWEEYITKYKIIVKPKAKDQRLICPSCGENKLFINYIKKGILDRGVVKGIGFIDTKMLMILSLCLANILNLFLLGQQSIMPTIFRI